MITPQKKAARQESRLAHRYGGTVTPGSGNGWRKKNDVRTPDLSIEAKYTDAKQFTLKQADLHTAETNALLDGKDSVFIISFGGEEWAVIREADFHALRDRRSDEPVDLTSADDRWPDLQPETDRYYQPMLPGADGW